MSEIAKIKPQEKGFSLTPRSLDEAMQYSELIAKSDIVPQDYRGKPGNVLIAIQMGLELGLPPMQALQNIAVINGRPAVWGDALIGIARAHPACEYITETFDERTMTATCKAKRIGQPKEVRTFSRADAEAAGLWGKNTWKSYPKRMLQMRARGFAIRDLFPDALRGLALAEEAQDIPERDMGAAERVESKPEPPSFPEYPDEKFQENLETWRNLIEGGRDPEQIINMICSKYLLSDEQKTKIRDLGQTEEETE